MKGQFRKLAIQSIASKHGVSFDEATKRYSRLSNREKDKLCQKMQGNYNCSEPSMAELFIEASWNRDPDLDFVWDMMP